MEAWLETVWVMFDPEARPVGAFADLPPGMSNQNSLHRYVHEDSKRCSYHPCLLELQLKEARERILSPEGQLKIAEHRSPVLAQSRQLIEALRYVSGLSPINGAETCKAIADRLESYCGTSR